MYLVGKWWIRPTEIAAVERYIKFFDDQPYVVKIYLCGGKTLKDGFKNESDAIALVNQIQSLTLANRESARRHRH